MNPNMSDLLKALNFDLLRWGWAPQDALSFLLIPPEGGETFQNIWKSLEIDAGTCRAATPS